MATFTGDASPIAYSWLASRLRIASVYFSSPAKMFVLLGIPGSSAVPRMPSGPGAHAVVRQGPRDVLSVFWRLYLKPLCPTVPPRSYDQPDSNPRTPPAPEKSTTSGANLGRKPLG